MSDRVKARDRKVSAASVTICFALILAVFGILLFWITHAPANTARSNANSEVMTCKSDVLAQIGTKQIDMALEDQIANHCIGLISNSYSIADYDVRRNAFSEQANEQHYVLWLVIVITCSGIFLTALQLWSALNLSVASGMQVEAGGSAEISNGKLSIQSSVAGLIILTLSFAFFLTYMTVVYPIRETDAVSKRPPTAIVVPNSSGPPIGLSAPIPIGGQGRSEMPPPFSALSSKSPQGGNMPDTSKVTSDDKSSR